jgi:PmbA protein
MAVTVCDLEVAERLLAAARRAGADAADVICAAHRSRSVAWRLGEQESVEQADSAEVGLRVLVGQRQALVSSSDLSPAACAELVSRAVSMARLVPDDPYCGLADPALLAPDGADLDSLDPVEAGVAELVRRAECAEAAALAVSGVTNSEGAEAGWSRDEVIIVASNGLCRQFARSTHSVSVSVLAGEGTAMERDYAYSTAVYGTDLQDAAALGREAGEKAVRRLNPRKVGSATVPVIFAPRVARSLLGHLTAAVNGQAVARGTTFLKDKLGERLFPAGTFIVDDPFRRRGLRSRAVDAEGIAPTRRRLIDDGVLTTWITDLRSARQLGLASTGHASRGVSSPPAPSCSNVYLEAGALSPEALIAETGRGLYVTDLMGFGVNGVTGDYSRGAAGFWIEDGALAYPVSEITISGHLIEMFQRLTAANDLEFRYAMDAPTVRIEAMTVAGR